jgi:hypothetical protein
MSQPQAPLRQIWVGTTKTYLRWSIASTFLLFPPLGVVAIFFSLKARAEFRAKRMPQGSRWADWAKTCNVVSLILGILTYWSLLAIYASLHLHGRT